MMSIKKKRHVFHDLNGMLSQQCLSKKAREFVILYITKNYLITGCPDMAETMQNVLTGWYFHKCNEYEVHFGTWYGQQWASQVVQW